MSASVASPATGVTALRPEAVAPAEAYGAVRLLEADPGIGEGLSAADRAEAGRRIVVPALRVDRGPWSPPDTFARALGATLTAGLLVRETGLFGRPFARLFGPGDLVDARALDPAHGRWTVLEPSQLALVDGRTVAAARQWPLLVRGLARRQFDAQREEQMLTAIVAIPRVEDRLLALFANAASRWGQVTTDGVALSLPATHDLLGRLIGARRPTVSLALKALRADGLLDRRADGRWRLPAGCDRWLVEGLPCPDADAHGAVALG